jgi:hypothetical protein
LFEATSKVVCGCGIYAKCNINSAYQYGSVEFFILPNMSMLLFNVHIMILVIQDDISQVLVTCLVKSSYAKTNKQRTKTFIDANPNTSSGKSSMSRNTFIGFGKHPNVAYVVFFPLFKIIVYGVDLAVPSAVA